MTVVLLVENVLLFPEFSQISLRFRKLLLKRFNPCQFLPCRVRQQFEQGPGGKWALKVPQEFIDSTPPRLPHSGAMMKKWIRIYDDPHRRTSDGHAHEPSFTTELIVMRPKPLEGGGIQIEQLILEGKKIRINDKREWKSRQVTREFRHLDEMAKHYMQPPHPRKRG